MQISIYLYHLQDRSSALETLVNEINLALLPLTTTVTDSQTLLSSETAAREAADSSLTTNVGVLQTQLDSETAAREAKDVSLEDDIDKLKFAKLVLYEIVEQFTVPSGAEKSYTVSCAEGEIALGGDADILSEGGEYVNTFESGIQGTNGWSVLVSHTNPSGSINISLSVDCLQLEMAAKGTTSTETTTTQSTETTPTNKAPNADAGPDQLVTDADKNGVETVTLDGTGSSDSDGTIASYEWKEGGTVLGSTATITIDLATGVHTITLTVSDDDGATSKDTVEINVEEVLNQAPIANAGASQQVPDTDNNGVETVTLDGTGSSDADGTIVSYEWKEGETVLGSTATITIDFALGSHAITLTVTDNEGATGTDIVNINVKKPPSCVREDLALFIFHHSTNF